jgi:hypothetical protein
MKTFKEFLAESTKTYMARVKIAGELPEKFENKLKEMMKKYETVSFKKLTTTPVQEHPHEFPRLKNQEVSIFDIEAAYPISHQMLEQLISDTFGIPQDHIRVKHPADPTETESSDDGEYVTKLSTDPEYKDDTAIGKPLYGDEYNMSLFKELVKSRKDSGREDVQGDGKIVEMGKEETASPVASNKKS